MAGSDFGPALFTLMWFVMHSTSLARAALRCVLAAGIAAAFVGGPAQGQPDPAREWAAYTLTQLRPSDEASLAQLVPYLRDASPVVAERIRWLFQVQDPRASAVVRGIRRADPALLRDLAGLENSAR